jgi:DNA-directed RNA polymerase II subunit RPB1
MAEIIDVENKTPSKIIGIQFGLLSPDEIRNGSVAEITSRDTYINNRPVINGLFDPRMGVLEPGLICPTDGHDYMKTPGYFGHINLARPIFYIQYFTSIMKIIRCVCFKCSKLLISKTKYKHALNMSPTDRWKFVFKICSKVKRCGEDTSDGCGCKRPSKIKKESMSTIVAEWADAELKNSNAPVVSVGGGVVEAVSTSEVLSMIMTPEIILKIFRRISDDDVTFMGFSPIWSRPDWMICQVLAVPPPSVRPSVKQDSQQRSEDDLTHIMVNIIKANNTLTEKIKMNASANVINDWTAVLQYYVATLVDNKISGVASVAQRSGRPLKSIKERLNGKGGRVRSNLMGKRVDFSARSVITPDPNISIGQLGIPMKIAMNITKPITVNERNKSYLLKLVRNGPDVYPGAKILEKKNGNNISLRYIDRDSIKLNEGDIVHRHMMDGDGILFNRQPTLHRMSMMCHIAKIMPIGDTFRMNVGVTKPYNADFDGDEMNLHMPQDIESESELFNLAAVPYQMISPANNKSIIGIFQDSLLGSYRFTRENISFTQRDAMNLLMSFNNVNVDNLQKEKITNFDILSQILPPMSIKYKTKFFKDDKEDYNKSNNILQIENGTYIRGQIEKGVLADGSRGLIQRICNDFGNAKAVDFIDDLQNIVTNYMKSSAYSVGVSDLIADKKTNDSINNAINKKKREVQSIIDQTHLGIFENKSGRSNVLEFETKVNNILNQASSESGKIGRESLSKENRFVIMLNAGSKGGDVNISQMISCLGQQNVDGRRIPYGFEDRTLPHFNKYDDSPNARGFVENSFISGLTPEELFFHAMGGRIGLIDTAVKTSQTGYIQRRLVKGMEDLKIEYDMTVRNNKNKIIQFAYGDDGFDTVKVEFQSIPIVKMKFEEIYAHFQMKDDNVIYNDETSKRLADQKDAYSKKSKEKTDFMIQIRDEIIDKVFKNKDNTIVHLPVSFVHIIENIYGQYIVKTETDVMPLIDITPLEFYEIVDNGFAKIESIHYVPPTDLFKSLYYFYLNPTELLYKKRFNRKTLTILIEIIVNTYKKAIVAPGEMVGIIAAQSIGEPTTQMTLNTFHLAGVASKSNVTRGVPRIEEILTLSENPKNPSCTIHLHPKDETNIERVKEIMNRIEFTKLREIVNSVEICFDPDEMVTLIKQDVEVLKQYNEFETMMDECNGSSMENKEAEVDSNKSKWILRMEMNAQEMVTRNISMEDVHFAIKNAYNEVSCVYSDYNSEQLVFRIRMNTINNKTKLVQNPLDQQDKIYVIKNFQDQLLDNLILRGIKHIKRVTPRKITDSLVESEGVYEKKETWVLDTIGTNLMDLLKLDYIDSNRTYTNDIKEIYNVFGIEAARQTILNELAEVIEFDSAYINFHHLSLLCDRMTCNDTMVSIFRCGINNDDIGPIAKASFEETPEMFLKAARHGEVDTLRGVSANVMCGQEGYFGTSAFQLVLDVEKMKENIEPKKYLPEDEPDNIISKGGLDSFDETCSTENLNITNTINLGSSRDIGEMDDEYTLGF